MWINEYNIIIRALTATFQWKGGTFLKQKGAQLERSAKDPKLNIFNMLSSETSRYF